MAREVNLTDLVSGADVIPTEVIIGESVTLEMDYNININVTILNKNDWSALEGEKSILNETLLSKAVWSLAPPIGTLVITW